MAKFWNLYTIGSPLLGFVLCSLSSWSSPQPVNGSNILAVLPSVWRSHYIFGRRLLQQLVDQQNHTVTLISPYCVEASNATDGSLEGTSPKLREIHVDKLFENWIDMGLSFDIEQAHQQSMLERFTRLIYAGTANVDLLLANSNVRTLLRSEEKFDLLVIDLFLSDALLGFALYYHLPTVVISPNGANTWLSRMIGNPQSSALDPSDFLPYTERMSVWERCVNTLMGLFEKLTYNFFHMISQQAVYVKHFQALYQLANNATVHLPHHRDLTQNVSLMLLNSHPVVQYPRALLPNILSVGGVHLQKGPLDIPHHIKSFIENASRGAVYISLGADARTVDLANEKLIALIDVISDLHDVHFLLKWELDEYPKNLPKNVMLSSWFPQEAILAHMNVKVFVTTCGMLSVLESINGLTPMLAIPIYPDQFVTATRLQAHGLALIVPFDVLNYEILLNSMKDLLENGNYHRNVQKAHDLLLSDYGTPTAKTMHYVDLVIKTHGADYLKTHAHHLNFMRSKLFDVIAIISLGLGGILAVPFLLICCILRRSYHNQSVVEGFSSPAVSSKNPRSKTTLIAHINNVNTSLKSGLITAAISVPSSLKDVAESFSASRVKRRLSSARAPWATSLGSSNESNLSAPQTTETKSTTSSNPSLFPLSAGQPNVNVNITKNT